MYYMERGLNMRWLAVFFAVALVVSSFGSGNLPQSNNMASGLEASFGIPTWMSGAVLAVLLGLVIIGGIRRIAVVAASIVPVMGIFYAHRRACGGVSNAIRSCRRLPRCSATPSAAPRHRRISGRHVRLRVQSRREPGAVLQRSRAGLAPIAHASARTEEPVSEGMVSILEPFIDTLLICTLTGLVILSSGVWTQKFETDFSPFDMEIRCRQLQRTNPATWRSCLPIWTSFARERSGAAFTGSLNVAQGSRDAELSP